MTEQTKLFMPELLKNIDIGDAKNVLDLGGADGSLAIELAKKYPDIKLTVFDRAEIKPLCEHHISLNHLVERVRFIEGNFLERVPLEYDCIIMKHILHDWTDEAVVAILSNCRNSLRTGDKLHIIDFCVDSNSQFYTSSLAIDAFMMMVHNGQERSLKQFEKVLGLARFKIVCVTPVGHEADIQAQAID